MLILVYNQISYDSSTQFTQNIKDFVALQRRRFQTHPQFKILLLIHVQRPKSTLQITVAQSALVIKKRTSPQRWKSAELTAAFMPDMYFCSTLLTRTT